MKSTVPIEFDYQIDTSLPEYKWPFMMVPVNINDRGPFRFVLELQRTITTFTKSLELRIESELEQKGRVLTLNEVSFPLYNVHKFSVGAAAVTDLEVLVWNVIQPHTTPAPIDHAKVKQADNLTAWDGILGFDFLSRFELTLNLQRKLLTLDDID